MGELTTARGDANVIKGSGDKEPMVSGDIAKDGYTKVAYPSEKPARKQTDVDGLKQSVGSLGNDGTSADAYEYQPKEIDSQDPKFRDGD